MAGMKEFPFPMASHEIHLAGIARLLGRATVALIVLLIMPLAAIAEEKTEIVIGAVNSMSGRLSPDGAEIRWAYEQAVADVNEKGGIFLKQYGKKLPVRLIIGDDESDAAMAAKVTERLIVRDKVDLILGTLTCDLMVPSIRVSDRHRVYHHAATCFNPIFLQNQFVYATNLFFDVEQATEVPFRILDSLPQP
jgi:branched-chain amino acid transport system substrate-binding protein